MPGFSFASNLSEDAGERSGFALSEVDILNHLQDQSPVRKAIEQPNSLHRIRADAYAEAVANLLYFLGATEEPSMPTLGSRFARSLGHEWKNIVNIEELLTIEAVAHHVLRKRQETGDLDRALLVNELKDIVGSRWRKIHEQLLESMSMELAFSPWYSRSVNTNNLIELANLFKSEALPVDSNTFVDQRFINYLSKHLDLLGSINWRQFEGLTAEWLSRQNYRIELGKGRNDGGIDVRAWRTDAPPHSPPAILVQCKREQRKIGKVIVKALWADVFHEQAKSGLIVTTNNISPGAEKVVNARTYPITTANRKQVGDWIMAMRKPAAGIIL